MDVKSLTVILPAPTSEILEVIEVLVRRQVLSLHRCGHQEFVCLVK